MIYATNQEDLEITTRIKIYLDNFSNTNKNTKLVILLNLFTYLLNNIDFIKKQKNFEIVIKKKMDEFISDIPNYKNISDTIKNMLFSSIIELKNKLN